ncbi:Pleckstrin homology domain-containing protein [Dichomitus squalens]|uniref:Pleckstrin homology domain-containing protein n=1 Tax=Dichomitus squalens TaxID=114155 RepID=A0A4V6MVY1_9APHY|nr:Pleckstrin homology domain-containing protein [Dichomitus squalens]
MRKRWQQSDWGRARRQQMQVGNSKKWIGSSFDIGVFLGVDIMDERLPSPPSQADASGASASAPPAPAISIYPTTSAAETFVTAPSHTEDGPTGSPSLSPIASHERDSSKVSMDSTAALVPSSSYLTTDTPTTHFAQAEQSSGLAGLPAQTQANGTPRSPSILAPDVGKGKAKEKGKDVHVHYEEIPAPPSEVLARTGSAVNVTSAGAVEQTTIEARTNWGNIIMRDRMLVRVSYTEHSVPATFDERQNRVTRQLENEGWVEYMVAWRKDRLELYTDHHTFGKAWFTDSKRLAYVAPLGSSSTSLSLYSYVDMSFCITCPPTPLVPDSKRVRYLHAGRGTHIFVFKPKSRSRAVDWIWHLWRQKGGQLPPFIEVRSPALDTRMRVDVPGFDTADLDAAYNVFQKDNVIRLCQKHLRNAPEYRALLERGLAEGATFELAWRLNTDLDWVWQEIDVRGKARRWAVLSGLALKQGEQPAHLEFRLKQHYPTRLHMKDGTRLDEPVAIEGYLDRIRPNSQLKQSLYLVTHDGYLFSLTPAHAHPPQPPGAPGMPSSTPEGTLYSLSSPGSVDTRRKADVRRGRLQILEATGAFDLRSIVAVRRAFQMVPQAREQGTVPQNTDWEDTEVFWEQVDRSESDDEDDGGESGVSKSKDKSRLRMRRSFELVLVSGRVLRFEAYSCATALEWIVRLRQLVSYWKKRHQVDARLEMNIAHVSTGRERITPQRPREDHPHSAGHDTPPEPLPNHEAALPELTFFYNWCVLDGCRAILKCGRLHGRKGWWGQYKHIQLVLLSGHLVQFEISHKSSLHHRRDKVINLLDAYVCSGYFAAQYLPEGQYDANKPPVARRYQDGLETDDVEEDTLFIVWYRNVRGQAEGVRRNNAAADVPPLKTKRKAGVFRTRSKLERDAWVWAINVEIEKVARASREREEAVRQAGRLLNG